MEFLLEQLLRNDVGISPICPKGAHRHKLLLLVHFLSHLMNKLLTSGFSLFAIGMDKDLGRSEHKDVKGSDHGGM